MPIRRMSGLSLAIPVAEAPAAPRPSQSAPSGRAPTLSSPDIPLDLLRKSPRLASLDAEMRLVRADIAALRQPGKPTLQADLSNVGAIVESENRRKPDLHLRYHDSAASLVESLASDPSKRRSRAVFRVDNRPGGPHHAAVDIRREPDKPLTLIVVEPATMGHMAHLLSHDDFVGRVKRTPGLEDARIAVIDAEAQKSPADCVMFSLSYASKMHKEQATFDLWHQRLAEGQPLADASHSKAPLPEGAQVVDGLQVLPASFYKHAHSLSNLLDARPELDRAIVGRDPDTGSGETLTERKGRLSLERRTEEGPRPNNNTSIEYKRHALLARTVQTLYPASGSSGSNEGPSG